MTATTLSMLVVLLWVTQLLGVAAVTPQVGFPGPFGQAVVLGMYASVVLLPLLFYVDFKDTSDLARRQGNRAVGWATLCVAVPVVGSTLVVPFAYLAEYLLNPLGRKVVEGLERLFE